MCVLRLVFLDSSLQSPGQEEHFAILFTSFRDVVREIVFCIHLVEEIMADLARFSALFIILCSSPAILREPPFFAREKHFGTFSVHVRLMVLELASLEKKKERK